MISWLASYRRYQENHNIIGVPFLLQKEDISKWLEEDISMWPLQAGEYKRTLTMLGKNTSDDRAKVQMEVNDIHALFKNFICLHRPQVNIEKVATGEHWFAIQAFERRLVDQLITSDDYLLAAKENFDIFLLHYKIKKPLAKRITLGFNNMLNKFISPTSGGRDYL